MAAASTSARSRTSIRATPPGHVGQPVRRAPAMPFERGVEVGLVGAQHTARVHDGDGRALGLPRPELPLGLTLERPYSLRGEASRLSVRDDRPVGRHEDGDGRDVHHRIAAGVERAHRRRCACP